MKHPEKMKYFYGMLSGFGAISLSILFFFLIYKIKVIYSGLETLSYILTPFIYGIMIAYLLCPICNTVSSFMSSKFSKLTPTHITIISVTVSILFGLFLVYTLVMMIVPPLIENVISLWNSFPEKFDNFILWLELYCKDYPDVILFFDTGTDQIYTAVNGWLEENILPNLMNIVSGVGMSVWKIIKFLKNALIGLIVSVYLLAKRKQIKQQGSMLLHSILKPHWANALLEELKLADRMFSGFISGKILDSGIIGIMCYTGCMIFHFPNALLVSVIVGVTNIIPFFGPFIGAVPSVILILLENPVKAVWFTLFILILQQLDGHIIGPAILGNSTGLSSFWVLFSIVLFGGLWGILGMIVGVPLFAEIYDITKKMVHRGLRRNGQEKTYYEE